MKDTDAQNPLRAAFSDREWRLYVCLLAAFGAVFLGGVLLWVYCLLTHRVPPAAALPAASLCGLLLAAASARLLIRNILRPYATLRSALRQPRYLVTEEQSYAQVLDNLIRDFSAAVSSRDATELLKIRAELDAMQSQINPHFLYNTLDSIRSQAIEDGSEATATMVETLSSLFRYTISQKNDMQSVYQELKNVRNYIKIQQYRFNNKYTLDIQIPDSDSAVMDYHIPKLTLQPIIENSIYHGLREKEGPCVITIRAYTTQFSLVIVISDNGVGMEDAQLQEMNNRFASNEYASTRNSAQTASGQGIALINVNARIRLIYGERYGMTAYSAPGVGTDIHITLPLKHPLESAK